MCMSTFMSSSPIPQYTECFVNDVTFLQHKFLTFHFQGDNNLLSVHYCGTVIPTPVRSGSRSVQINYVTAGIYGSTGFALQYQTASELNLIVYERRIYMCIVKEQYSPNLYFVFTSCFIQF